MRNIWDKIKRCFRNSIVVGLTIALITAACANLRQIWEDRKSKFDVSAEMMNNPG